MERWVNMKTRRIDLGLAVLGSISRQSKQSGRLTKPVLDDVKRDLKQRYGEEFSDTWLLEKISKLEDMGLVRRARGILRNGRETVYTTKRGEEVALTLIKLSDEEAFVHNGWEGTVYDPPLGEASVERKTIESDEKRLKEMKRELREKFEELKATTKPLPYPIDYIIPPTPCEISECHSQTGYLINMRYVAEMRAKRRSEGKIPVKTSLWE